MSIQTTIQGMEDAQRIMLRAVQAVDPKGGAGRAVKKALFIAQAYAASITHQDTSTLSRSHIIQYDGGAVGYVQPSPYNINPRSHKPASYYAIYEEARGGAHAFYQRTITEIGPRIVDTVGAEIRREIS